MKVVGVFGLLVLIFGLLITLIGFGGAVANFFFAPESPNCKLAEEDYQKAQELLPEYEAAKGTSDEALKKMELEEAIAGAQASRRHCSEAKDSHRFYGMAFAGVGVVGFVMTLIGAIAAFFGLRKKKSLA